MGRHRKPDALSAAEHQRNHVAQHGLRVVRVTPAVAEALSAACKRTGKVLVDALEALGRQLDEHDRQVAMTSHPTTPPAPSKPRRKSSVPSKAPAPDLFSES